MHQPNRPIRPQFLIAFRTQARNHCRSGPEPEGPRPRRKPAWGQYCLVALVVLAELLFSLGVVAVVVLVAADVL
jgi:hypothetical protein